ncbi:hypothetical protein GCM10023215_47410 [Pseudonocardia yuanmonensis]|uniref:Arrestin-like N-terminal domain-containing protein n=1 Tax=Pseudonocardia yuanmonensis TaxID=1095914 RepID=A0ABP8XC58_9PSEU
MFGRRRRAAAVEIRTDREVYRPGDTVRARVRLTPGTDLPDPEIVVALLHADSISESGSSWTDSWAVDGRYVFQGRSLRAGEAVEVEVDLRVPDRSLPFPDVDDDPLVDDPEDYRYEILRSEVWGAPTSIGKALRSEWFVQVIAPGTDERAAITVLAVGGPAEAATEPRGDSDRLARITLDGLPQRSVPAGATVTGRLRVDARTELDARALRVDLVLVETQGDRVLTAERKASTTVSGPARLTPGAPRDLAFSLTLPPDLTPSITTESWAISWVLFGVVDLPRREDAVGKRMLPVHDPRA